MKATGFSLLEVMLVITLAALIIVISTRALHYSEQKTMRIELRSNITTIFNALDDYYHAQTCTNSGAELGIFPSVNTDLFANLESDQFLQSNQLKNINGISSYQAEVVPTGQYSHINDKPVYALQVDALLAAGLSTDQQNYLASATKASLVAEGDGILRWQTLPNKSARFRQGNSLWYLQAEGDAWKQGEVVLQSMVDSGAIADSSCLN